MYRFRERKHGHKKLYASLIIFILLVGVAMMVGAHLLTSDTRISAPPKPIIKHVSSVLPQTVPIHERLFSLALPTDWKPRVSNDMPLPSYSWRGTNKGDDTRWMNVYVDAIPTNLAVNRVLPLTGNGATLSLPTNVSDNCTTFTGATGPTQLSVMAKWQGISFLCDTGNYERDVVGTSSLDGINTVTLRTATNGTHHFFFTYTDNSPSPDYSIFTAILKSFRLN